MMIQKIKFRKTFGDVLRSVCFFYLPKQWHHIKEYFEQHKGCYFHIAQ
jgi:hypothetical protein